jgi:DNA excision repair protein ERCC-2
MEFQNLNLASLKAPILAMCLSSRKNLCINEKVSCFDERERVDSECRARTASWVREKVVSDKKPKEEVKMMKIAIDIEDIGELCGYYEGFMDRAGSFKMPSGIYTLDDLRKFGKK